MTTVARNKVISQESSSSNGGSENARITVLENNEYKVTYSQQINSQSGTISIPAGATILLDQYPGGVDALVSKSLSGKPNGEQPQTTLGASVDVSSFDALGNYTLSGIPSSYPVILIYTLKIKAIDYPSLVTDNILDYDIKGSSGGSGIPGGLNTQIQFNDSSAFNGANVNYNKVTERTGFQKSATSTEATIHADAIKGESIQPPVTATVTASLDIAINSPSSASVTQILSPPLPTAPGISFNYIDQVNDNGVSSNIIQNTGTGNYTANGQTLYWYVYAYRMIGSIRVTNPNYLLLQFTDTINDNATNFEVQLGNMSNTWTTTNGFFDGFILVGTDHNGNPYQLDIAGSTYFTDNGGNSNNDLFENSSYPSNSTVYSTNYASYTTINSSNYRSYFSYTGQSDGNYSGAYLIIQASLQSVSGYDGNFYQSYVGYYFDLGILTTFNDWGQVGIGDITPFSAVCFPYINTSITGASSSIANAFNYGSGSFIADSSNWTLEVWGYRYNQIDNQQYFINSPDTASFGTDDNSGNTISFTGSYTNGDADGYVIKLLKNSTVVASYDNSSNSTFTFNDPSSDISTSLQLSSYSGLSWVWNAYGYVTSPSVKYSSSSNNYSANDGNPVGGFIWNHNLSGFGNSTDLKIIENSFRNGYFYSGANQSVITQTYGGVGDNVHTPNTIGYISSGQTINYRIYAKKTTIYSSVSGVSAYLNKSYTFPNDGLFRTLQLTITAVSGATGYKVNKVGTGYYSISGTVINDSTSLSWSDSSTVTPLEIIGATEILDWDSSTINNGVIPFQIRNKTTSIQGELGFMYQSSPGVFSTAARFGVTTSGLAFIDSYNIGLDIGKSSPYARISGVQGTTFNLQGSSSSSAFFRYRGSSVFSIIYLDPTVDTAFFGATAATFGDPQSAVSITPVGSDYGITFNPALGSNDSSIFARLTNSSNSTFWTLRNDGKMSIARSSAVNGNLHIGSGSAIYSQIQLDHTSTLANVAGGIGYQSGSYYGGNSAAIPLKFQQQFQTGAFTSGNWIYCDSNGNYINDGKIQWNGSYLNTSVLWLFQQGLSVSSGKFINVANETINTIAYIDASRNIRSLPTATYPSLTEFSYVKGVTSAIQTQLNTKLSAQVIQLTSSATPTVSVNGYMKTFVDITALAVATNLSANLTGTPQNGDILWFQIKDNGTARVITCGSLFEAKGEALPTTTVISKRINMGFTWDSTTSKWGCIAVVIEA
jgi:hypothetical protein